MIQPRKIIWLITLVVFVLLLEGSARRAAASPQDQGQTPGQQQGSFAVGHATRVLNVLGIHGETRLVNVHLWYPAPDPQNCQSGNGNSQGCPTSVYTSRLNGIPLLPQWDPLSWTIGSTHSFEELPVSSAQSSWPVIIFSHGNQNNAIDYVYTLEGLASSGFIVAAPDHLNNTQDDVLIDFINGQANSIVIPCFDGRPSPCAHTSIAESMTDRVNDIRKIIIDGLPSWFGDRADTSRVGVMGHSRGSVTALASVGGSTTWGFPANSPLILDLRSHVKAIMGLSIGTQSVTQGVDLLNVTVPTLLLSGLLDQSGPPLVSQFAYKNISSKDKALVTIPEAKHRHFDSGLCAQTQSSGAIAQANPLRAILDRQTVINILIPVNPSGTAMDYCGYDTFTNPTDITTLVSQLTGVTVTSTSIPTVPPGFTTGLTSDEVKDQVVIPRAVAFFNCVFTQTNASCATQ